MKLNKLGFLLCLATIALVYVAFRITYMQNDEYIHYQTVQNFMTGSFQLEPYLASTFYAQGLLAVTFAQLFGIRFVPVLTALVAAATLYVLSKILSEKLNKPLGVTFVATTLLFVNPLFLYLSQGFMTEMYALFFLLLALYYVYSKNFALANVLFVLGFFVKQFTILGMVAWAILFLVKKDYKYFVKEIVLIAVLAVYYLRFFPHTQQMEASGPLFSNMLNFNHAFSLIYVVGIYLAVFTLPFIVAMYFKKQEILLTTASVILIFAALTFFAPTQIRHVSVFADGTIDLKHSPDKFPYLPNVFTENGFLADSLAGSKYGFYGASTLFFVLDKLGKAFAILALVLLVRRGKDVINFESIFIVVFVAFLIISPKVYDRYLLILVPIVLILLAKQIDNFSRVTGLVSGVYILLFAFIGYQFVQDFHYVNDYTWNRGQELHATQDIPLNKIRSENSWHYLYPNTENKWDYLFEFKGTEKQRPEDENYELFETHTIDYPLNAFEDSTIYLVKTKR